MKAMHVICLAALLACAAAILGAQTEDWQWIYSAGTSGNESGISLAADAAGNSYVAGTFSGTLTLGTFVLQSQGDADVFVGKLDPDRNWLWVRRCGSPDAEFVYALDTDSSGNVLVAGSFYNSATFGDISLNSAGDYDIYVAKLDPAGNWLWAIRGGGLSFDEARDVACDASGNVYITGSVVDSGLFGTIPVTTYGNSDAIVAKASPTGNWLWCTRGGGTDSDYGMALYVEASANLYVTGSFAMVGNFGTSSIDSAGYHDIFAGKLDSAGNWIWIRQAGGEFEDWGHKIVTDATGNVYVVGVFRMSASFGAIELSAVTGAISEIFVAKIGSAGNWAWVKQAGGYDFIFAGDIGLDNLNQLYVAGYFRGEALFGTHSLTSYGQFDVYLAKISASGTWLHCLQAGGTGNDLCNGMDVREAELWLTGSYGSAAEFGSFGLTNAGGNDLFVGKILGNTPVTDEVQTSPPACSLGNWPNPFSNSTTISLKLGSNSGIQSLEIFNQRGQRVRNLLQGRLGSGEHLLAWDGRDGNGKPLPAGIYLARLCDGAQTALRKLILLR